MFVEATAALVRLIAFAVALCCCFAQRSPFVTFFFCLSLSFYRARRSYACGVCARAPSFVANSVQTWARTHAPHSHS
jgi:hypothetical protein